MSKWKPIDTAPKDGTVILGWRYYVVAIRWTGDQEYPWEAVMLGNNPLLSLALNGFNGDDQALTHWMPLPDPPTAS